MAIASATVPGARVRRLRLFESPRLDARQLTQHYACHTYHDDHDEFRQGHGVTSIQLAAGALRVDDWPILEPSITYEHLSWCQQTAERFSSGVLHFDKGHTELHGVVFAGSTSEDAVAHHVVATTIRDVAYATRITTRREPDGTQPESVPADGWTDGLGLTIGYRQKIGQPAPQPYVELDGQDISDMTSWTIDPKTQQTVLLVNLDAGVVCTIDPTLYLEARVAFDQLVPVPTMSGVVSATCSDPTGSGSYLWTGAPHAAPRPTPAAAMLAVAPARVLASDLLRASSLQVSELMTIVPDSTVSDQANAMIVRNMKWAFTQSDTEKDWLAEFFGEQPPVLTTDEQSLANKSLDWYQNHFGKAYLSSSFTNYAGPNAPTVKPTDAQQLKLSYYLKTGLGKDPDFSVQQNGVHLQAFVEAKPRLQGYIADAASNWAQQLYDIITSPAQLILMVNRIWGAAGQPGTLQPANNFATLLSALQGPAGPLAGQYMHQVMAATLSNSAHQTTWTHDAVMEWLPDFLQTLLTQIATSGKVPDDAKILAEQIKEMQAQLGGSLIDVATELANFVINANGANILQKTQNAQTAFLQKWPKLTGIANGLFFMAWCGGIFMVVKAFQNWRSLKPEDKAKAILTTVQLGLSAIDVVPAFLKGIKEMGLKGWNQFQEWRSGTAANDQVGDLNSLEDVDADWVRVGADETSPLFNAAEGEVKTTGTLWESIFEGAGKVVGVIGVAVSAAFAVLSTVDFVKDILSGQPVSKIVLDGVMAAANIGLTVCLVLDMVVAATVFAMAAAVLAVIGIIVAIIEMFVVKPKNPLDEFMSDTVIPFIDGLPPQTAPPSPTGSAVQLALA